MISGLSDELLARLIVIGQREVFDEFDRLLADFRQARSGDIMRQPFHDWYDIARRHSRDDVTALIKALTVAEGQLPNFGCGSVSPVIPLYRYLLDSGEDFTELRDWIVTHTRNQYLPFGSGRYRPASLSEYFRQAAEHEARRRAREEAEQEAMIVRHAAREKQRCEQQQVRLRLRHSRAALIESLRPLSPADRLAHIIADTAHPVSFYPEEWAMLDSATLNALPSRLLFAAIQRLADRRRGVWKKLREQLEKIV
jgi:hypothetical protein